MNPSPAAVPPAGTSPAASTAPARTLSFVASRPRPILKTSEFPTAIESESDEERTHYNVLSRRLHKRRKTNRALVSNPFREVPQTKFELSSTPPMFGIDGAFANEFDTEDAIASSPGALPQQRLVNRRSSAVPESDQHARQRCYEYIHTAIDAVWAEYCDSTSFAESQKYMPHSPISDGECFASSSSEDGVGTPKAVYTHKRHARSDSISMQPLNQSLMKQKKRLVDAKYLLSHFVSSPDAASSASFWQVWDHMKYNTAEIVEGDDEDVEEVIDELEEGRCQEVA